MYVAIAREPCEGTPASFGAISQGNERVLASGATTAMGTARGVPVHPARALNLISRARNARLDFHSGFLPAERSRCAREDAPLSLSLSLSLTHTHTLSVGLSLVLSRRRQNSTRESFIQACSPWVPTRESTRKLTKLKRSLLTGSD